jgi:hypothetical protein
VWDLAIASGASHTPGVGRAFQVLLPGMGASAAKPARPEPLPVLPLDDAGPAVPAPSGAPGRESVWSGEAAARSMRRWETLLYAALLVVIAIGLVRMRTFAPEAIHFEKPQSRVDAYNFYAHYDPISLRPRAKANPGAGWLGASLVAEHLAVGGILCLSVAWATWCLTFGPCLRRVAVWTLWLLAALLVTRAGIGLALTGSTAYPLFDPIRGEYFPTALSAANWFGPVRTVGLIEMAVTEVPLLASLLLLFRAGPIRALFAFRPERRLEEDGREGQ